LKPGRFQLMPEPMSLMMRALGLALAEVFNLPVEVRPLVV